MGWKGAIRSIGAAARAADRNAKRQQRELDRQQKQYEKMEALEQAAHEVEVYKNYIDLIQSVHLECGSEVNWENISLSKKPIKPTNKKMDETAAKEKESAYKPNLFDKLFKKEQTKRQELVSLVLKAQENDEVEYGKRLFEWEAEVNDWNESVKLANRVLEGDNEAKIEAIKELNPFSELGSIGSGLSISIGSNSLANIAINIHGEDIVPKEIKSLLKSGKLSVKKMPIGTFNEIYQDYVCSAVLRVANEFFAVLPDDKVIVTALDKILNKETGHIEELPIISVYIPRNTLSSLNMDAIDPSDSMNNFICNMSFKKTKGFDAVSKVVAPELCDISSD